MTNWLLIIKREQFSILKTPLENPGTGVSQRSNQTVLKTDPGYVALLTDNFSPFKSYPERFLSSLKKTILPNLVKIFETVMVTSTSGRKCVFFKEKIIHITIPDNSLHIEFASTSLQNYKPL